MCACVCVLVRFVQRTHIKSLKLSNCIVLYVRVCLQFCIPHRRSQPVTLFFYLYLFLYTLFCICHALLVVYTLHIFTLNICLSHCFHLFRTLTHNTLLSLLFVNCSFRAHTIHCSPHSYLPSILLDSRKHIRI